MSRHWLVRFLFSKRYRICRSSRVDLILTQEFDATQFSAVEAKIAKVQSLYSSIYRIIHLLTIGLVSIGCRNNKTTTTGS